MRTTINVVVAARCVGAGAGMHHHTGVFKYKGDWREDKRHGKGTCFYADGAMYEGDWADDAHHGHGVWTTVAGMHLH